MGWMFGAQQQPTLPAVQARPPDKSISGPMTDSPFAQDTLLQFLTGGPVNTRLAPFEGPETLGAISPVNPREVMLNSMHNRNRSRTKHEQESTLSHEMVHTGSFTNSLNIPDEVQTEVLKRYWAANPELAQEAEGMGISREYLEAPTTFTGSTKSRPTTQRLGEKEEAIARAFQRAMDLVRGVTTRESNPSRSIQDVEKDFPGAEVMFNWIQATLNREK